MSLVQHVSSVEGTDRVDLASLYDAPDNASLQLGGRLSLTLSYDPLPRTAAVATDKLEPEGSYKVSARKRTAQVIVGVCICFAASGIVFGFAALKEVLIAENAYRDLCTDEELARDERLCYMQDQRLNLNFIIGSVTTNLSALFVGSLLDRYGPRLCGLVSSLVLFLGSLSMALNSSLPFDGYALGFLLLALGGTFSFVPSFHLSNAFPRLQGLILALITGAFDASAAVFLAFRLIYQSTAGDFGIQQFFLLYLVIPILVLLANLFLLPSHSYETRTELETHRTTLEDNLADLHDSDDELPTTDMFRVRSDRAAKRRESVAQIDDLIGPPAQQTEHDIAEDDKKIASGVWGVLHGVPARKQMITPWFILIALFTVLQMTRFNFFISTIWSQYEYMLGSGERATQVAEFFDLALPIGGVATVPFIGLLLDNTSTVTVLSLLVLMSTVIGALGAMPTPAAAYLSVCLFVVFRPLYYSAMSDYAAKIFGFATFGTVYGTIICLSGLSLFSQPALQALVHDVYYEDPGPVNLGLAGAGLLIGIALVMYVDAQARNIRRMQFQVFSGNVDPNDLDDDARSMLSVSLGGGTLGRGAIGGPGGGGYAGPGGGGYTGPGSAAAIGGSVGRMRSPSPRLWPIDSMPNQNTNPLNPGLYANYGSFAHGAGALNVAPGLPGMSGVTGMIDRAGIGIPSGADESAVPTQAGYRLRHTDSKQGLGAVGTWQLASVREGEEPEEDEMEGYEDGKQTGEWMGEGSGSLEDSADESKNERENGNRKENGNQRSEHLAMSPALQDGAESQDSRHDDVNGHSDDGSNEDSDNDDDDDDDTDRRGRRVLSTLQ